LTFKTILCFSLKKFDGLKTRKNFPDRGKIIILLYPQMEDLVPIYFDYSYLNARGFAIRPFRAYLKRMQADELWTYFEFMKMRLLRNYEKNVKMATYWLKMNTVVKIAEDIRKMLNDNSLVQEFSMTLELETNAEKKLRPQRHLEPDIWLVQTFAAHICDQLRSARVSFNSYRDAKKRRRQFKWFGH